MDLTLWSKRKQLLMPPPDAKTRSRVLISLPWQQEMLSHWSDHHVLDLLSFFLSFFFFLICSRAINVILMQSGGPSYPVELGRLDGLSSTAASVNGKLPQPTFSLNQLTAMFAANGLSQTDMIALSGMTIIIVIVLNSRAPITDILSWWVPKLDLSWPHLFIYINGAPFINQTHKQPFNLYSYLFFKNEMMHIIGHFFLFEDRSIFRWIYNFIELDFFFA